jgi:predicted transcriptional regulator
MPNRTDIQRALEAFRSLPEGASLEDAIGRLRFIAKIEEGLEHTRAGQLVSQNEVKQRCIS